MDNVLVIVRGIPGSGKSTFSNKLLNILENSVHYETDQYFVVDGQYVFDRKKLGQNHEMCFNDAMMALMGGKTVIVSNTFTTMNEMNRYIKLAEWYSSGLIVVNMNYNFKSVHDVPSKTLEYMKKRYVEPVYVCEELSTIKDFMWLNVEIMDDKSYEESIHDIINFMGKLNEY